MLWLAASQLPPGQPASRTPPILVPPAPPSRVRIGSSQRHRHRCTADRRAERERGVGRLPPSRPVRPPLRPRQPRPRQPRPNRLPKRLRLHRPRLPPVWATNMATATRTAGMAIGERERATGWRAIKTSRTRVNRRPSPNQRPLPTTVTGLMVTGTATAQLPTPRRPPSKTRLKLPNRRRTRPPGPTPTGTDTTTVMVTVTAAISR